MYALVLDPSALIPCGDKSERDKEAIKRLGDILYRSRTPTIYLSHRMIRVYKSAFSRWLKYHHPLPPFQAGLQRVIIPYLIEISTRVRGKLCKETPVGSVKFHILENSKVQRYNVDNLGLSEDEDKEVLRVTLTAATKRETFLVTVDRQFLEELNLAELSRRYPDESQKIRIVKPDDNFLIAMLIAETLM